VKKSILAACLALALPVFAQSTAPLSSGKDTSAFDPNVRVQDDFYGG
jgi:hypothetical protein